MKHKELDPSFLLDLYSHYSNVEVRRNLSHVKYITWTSGHRDWSEPDFKMKNIPESLKKHFVGLFMEQEGDRWIKMGVVFVDNPDGPTSDE